MTELSVRDAAQQTGVSVYTLHYYEREGLLRVGRTSSGHRRYAPSDLGWIKILTCLRETGMPIRTMREFAALVKTDQSNIPERIRILGTHRTEVLERMSRLTQNLEVLDGKLGHYQRMVEG